MGRDSGVKITKRRIEEFMYQGAHNDVGDDEDDNVDDDDNDEDEDDDDVSSD